MVGATRARAASGVTTDDPLPACAADVDEEEPAEPAPLEQAPRHRLATTASPANDPTWVRWMRALLWSTR